MSTGGMIDQQTIAAIKQRYICVAATLDERGRRAVAAAEALTLGWGGITAVARATGLSRTVIQNGIKELRGRFPVPPLAASAVGVADASRSALPTRPSATSLSAWWSLRPAAIPSRRSAGPARACASWQSSWASEGIE